MKVVALISGGKDSCFNMLHCVANGHEIVALANLKPAVGCGKDELDSYMYQTVGHDAIDFYGECMELPLFRREIVGSSIAKDADYTVTLQDEVEDLYQLLKEVKEKMPEVQAVASGAILSNYQRVRVEHVCLRLGLTSLSYLWQRDQKKLMEDMIAANVNAILIKVAAIGLEVKHLGKSLSRMFPHLLRIHELYDCHICGEGGEFETFTLDIPIFKKRIVIDTLETVLHSDDAFAPVAYAKIKKAHLEAKRPDEIGMSAELQQTLVSTMDLEVHVEPEPMNEPSQILVDVSADFRRDFDHAAAVSTSIKGPYMAIGGLMARNVCTTEPPHVNQTIAQETITVMNTIQEQLQSNGFAWDCVVVMHVYLDDMSKFAQLNEAYKNYFGLNPPPRITVQLSLPYGAQVQVDCLAFRSANVPHKRSLHVQSISYWAPANIGPYSQACYAGDQTYIAGQIGLIPQCMELVAPAADDQRAFAREALLALQHSQAILLAIGGDLVADAALCVCYVSDGRYFAEARRIWRNATERCLIQVPVILVAVPGLPRGANVEWEIVSGNRASLPAYTIDLEDGGAVEVSDPVGYNGTIATPCSTHWTFSGWSRGTLCVLTACCSMSTLTERITPSVIQESWNALSTAYESALSCLNPRWKDLLSIRIFYNEKIPCVWVNDVVRQCLKTGPGSLEVAVTFVPVAHIADQSFLAVAIQATA